MWIMAKYHADDIKRVKAMSDKYGMRKTCTDCGSVGLTPLINSLTFRCNACGKFKEPSLQEKKMMLKKRNLIERLRKVHAADRRRFLENLGYKDAFTNALLSHFEGSRR